MGVAAAKTAAPVAPTRAPLVRTQADLHTLHRACECSAAAGLSGHCAACDRTDLSAPAPGAPQPAHDAAVRTAGAGLGHHLGQLQIVSTRSVAGTGSGGKTVAGLGKNAAIRHSAPMRPQARLRVSAPGDAAEREAHSMAELIMRMPDHAPNPPAIASRDGHDAGVVHRLANDDAVTNTDALEHVSDGASGGATLPEPVRGFMESRFGADFSGVRVHTDDRAASLSGQLSAQAFTVGRDIYFGRQQFQPNAPGGRELIAHELTHTIQQGGASQRLAPTAPAAPAVPAPVPARVAARAPASVQRFGIGDAWNYFADKANLIPGFRMLTILLGMNPINMVPVERSAANVLRAIVEFIPGGGVIVQALQNSGVFDKVGAWVIDQIATLSITGAALRAAANTFLGSLKWSDIFHLGDVWERAKRIFSEPIDRLIAFVKTLITGILKFIKDAILMPLAKLAEGTRGWDLLIAVLGNNPITGEAVPRTADTLIGGFLKLIGQDEIWDNMKKSNAVGRAWTWFQSAMSAVLGFVSQIPSLFLAALQSLTIQDVVLVAGAFQKVASVFGGFLAKFSDWAGTAIWNLLEIIFDVVSPGALGYVKKTGAAIKSIFKNPIPFVGNLVRAAKLGLQNFASHFGTHLKEGLIDWLTGSLPGVYIPKAISLPEIGKFAMSVLGVTWAQIRGKIVKALGANGEKIMSGLETTFDVVVALVKGGPAAAWELIKDKLTDLKDTVISGITSFVIDTIVEKAVPKLISLFVPGAGFISAILSIYDTVMVFVEKLAKIGAAVKAFIDSIVAIAGGQIEVAAAKVESALSGLVSLAISFLAGFLGLGNIAARVMAVITKVRSTVDKAMDAGVAWIVTKAKGLFGKLFGKGDPNDIRTDVQKQADLDKGIAEAEALRKTPHILEADIRKGLPAIQKKYKMTSLSLVVDGKNATTETVHFKGTVNPEQNSNPGPIDNQPGSRDNPIEIAWVKPVVAGYPSIDVGGKTFKPLDGGMIGTNSIKVTHPSALAIADGAVIQAGEQQTSDSTKDYMRDTILKKNGWTKDSPMDVDHIWEKQLGGPDAISNLWPLDASTNRRSGGLVQRERKRIIDEYSLDKSPNTGLKGRFLKLKFGGAG